MKMAVSGFDFDILKNIFFETASYELKPESTIELKKLVSLVQNNKNISVILGLVRESNHKNNAWTHANGLITKLVITL